ncbi:hypothetical protein NDU88_000494 [Pleurodeles waltl]|uniref:Uncharacterized protein n=1 Tax=Pleurodeles waltl TaxID=8319 RepID=A0AAV7P114_PLEWA|nr:hypothetical protein NDU88_000494 [Pleurodeles waltl]
MLLPRHLSASWVTYIPRSFSSALRRSGGRDHRLADTLLLLLASGAAARCPKSDESQAEPHPIGSPAPGAPGPGRHRRRPHPGQLAEGGDLSLVTLGGGSHKSHDPRAFPQLLGPRGRDQRHPRHAVSFSHLQGHSETLGSGRASVQATPNRKPQNWDLRIRQEPPQAALGLSGSALISLSGFFPHGPSLSFSVRRVGRISVSMPSLQDLEGSEGMRILFPL